MPGRVRGVALRRHRWFDLGVDDFHPHRRPMRYILTIFFNTVRLRCAQSPVHGFPGGKVRVQLGALMDRRAPSLSFQTASENMPQPPPRVNAMLPAKDF